MVKANTGITVEKSVLERNDEIREALGEQSPAGDAPGRSQLVETLLKQWNEEHEHLLDDDDGGDTGNRSLTLATVASS